MKFYRTNIDLRLTVILFIFGLVYASISLVNHFLFRTYGWDLGLYNNALYDYSRFQWNNEILLLPYLKISNSLGDHFSLTTVFISPLVWIFGSYTMLIFQIASILWGGYGIYRYVEYISGEKKTARWATVHFLSMWGIYSALAFDYHDNVVAAMFVPWFMLYVFRKKYLLSSLFLLLILTAKENMALWTIFICIGLITILYKEKRTLIYLMAATIFSGLYFIVVSKFVIPSLSGSDNDYIHFRYNVLGSSMKEALFFFFQHPVQSFTILFENHTGNPAFYGIKSELHFLVLLSGGIALFYKPQFLLMLIPIYFQKMFHNDPGKWGIFLQYSVEFAPILTIAVFYSITKAANKALKNYLMYATVACSLLGAIYLLDHKREFNYPPEQARFYQKQHYQTNYNIDSIYSAMKLIPPDAKVSAHSMLVPHLAIRDVIYYFPYIGDAEYVMALPSSGNYYPLNKNEFLFKLDSLQKDISWQTIYVDSSAILIKKR